MQRLPNAPFDEREEAGHVPYIAPQKRNIIAQRQRKVMHPRSSSSTTPLSIVSTRQSRPFLPKPAATHALALSDHALSSLLLKFFVRFMSFLYLCFFIFNFRCLFTLIACHTSLSARRSRYCNCLSLIRPRKGWLRGEGGKYRTPSFD